MQNDTVTIKLSEIPKILDADYETTVDTDIIRTAMVKAGAQDTTGISDKDYLIAEAAMQLGFMPIDDDASVYVVTEADLIAFGKRMVESGEGKFATVENVKIAT